MSNVCDVVWLYSPMSLFVNMCYWFGEVGLCTLGLYWGVSVCTRYVCICQYICHGYMCIHWYVTLIWCCGVPEICGWWGGTSAMGICAFFYMWHWFSVVVFQRSMVNWGGTSAMDIYAFFYMWHWFGVVVFKRCTVNGGVDLPLHLPIWALTVEMWDLPLHLPIWALTVEMWNWHSWPLDASTGV